MTLEARPRSAIDRAPIASSRAIARSSASFSHTSAMSALLASSFVSRVAAFKPAKVQVRLFCLRSSHRARVASRVASRGVARASRSARSRDRRVEIRARARAHARDARAIGRCVRSHGRRSMRDIITRHRRRSRNRAFATRAWARSRAGARATSPAATGDRDWRSGWIGLDDARRREAARVDASRRVFDCFSWRDRPSET